MQYHHLRDSVEVVVLAEAVEVFEVPELLTTEATNSRLIGLKWDQLMPLTQNHHMSAFETDFVD